MSTSVKMLSDVRKKLYSIEQKHKRFEQQQLTFIKALERSRDDARDKTEPVSTVMQVEKYMNHHCSNTTDNHIISQFFEIMADLEEVLQLLESLSKQNPTCEGLNTCRELLDPHRNISQLRAQLSDRIENFRKHFKIVQDTSSKPNLYYIPAFCWSKIVHLYVALLVWIIAIIPICTQSSPSFIIDSYPHNEVNRLSCHEAWNFYGGIVSVIPLALDHLTSYCKEATQLLTSTAKETSPPQTDTQNTETSAGLHKSNSNNSYSYKGGTGGCHARKEA